jgi:hypothetical protein
VQSSFPTEQLLPSVLSELQFSFCSQLLCHKTRSGALYFSKDHGQCPGTLPLNSSIFRRNLVVAVGVGLGLIEIEISDGN